jgi:hypothetical protein
VPARDPGCGDEPIPSRLARAAGIVQAVVDDPHGDALAAGLAGTQLACRGAVGKDLQLDVLAAAPHQLVGTWFQDRIAPRLAGLEIVVRGRVVVNMTPPHTTTT